MSRIPWIDPQHCFVLDWRSQVPWVKILTLMMLIDPATKKSRCSHFISLKENVFEGVFLTQSWPIWNSLIQGTWPLLVSSARNERPFAHRCSLFRDAGRSENLGVNSNRRSFIVTGFVFRSAQIWGANYPLCPPASGVSAISVLLGLCCVKHYLLSLIFCASWLLGR